MSNSNRNTSIFLIDESESFGGYRSNGIEIIESTIDIYDKELPIHIGVIDQPLRLLDIVPLAQSISEKLCSSVIRHLSVNKQYVPCHKSCCACCSYLVSLSLPEVFYLQESLSRMPTDSRNRILRSCIASAKKILDIDVLKRHNLNYSHEMTRISAWYSELGIFCPFLSNGTCSIYEKRPFACREHMVITSPASCKTDRMNNPEVVSMPVSLLEALGQLSADLEETEVEAIILPLALASWNDDDVQRSHRTWPTKIMAKHFIHILEAMSKKHAAEPAMSE